MRPSICRIYLLLMVLVFSSCDYELCYTHPHNGCVRVTFDWRNAPDAEVRSMALLLFPDDGSEPMRYDFANATGGEIIVPQGSYSAACFNTDTETLMLRGLDNRNSAELHTSSSQLLGKFASFGVSPLSVPRAGGSESQRIIKSPELFWTDRAEGLRLEKDDYLDLTLYPSQGYAKVSVTLENADNLRYALGLSGSLSALAGGHKLASCSPGDEVVTQEFDAFKESDGTTVKGQFISFGHPAADGCSHSLIIYAVLSDNSKWFYTYDVTDQVHNAPDPLDIHIHISGLPLPKPIQNGSGFAPDIDRWQTVRYDIEL